MKLPIRSLALIALLAATFPAPAQEQVSGEEAQRIAHKLNDTLGNPSDAPFATEVDSDKPHGFKAGSAGIMAIPDRRLTSAGLEGAGKDVLPVGQLWSLGVSAVAEGRAVSTSLLRMVKVGEGEKARDVQLYYLGAAKNDAGELQLIIFAKDKTQPLLRVPLKKISNSSQSLPLELEGRKQSDDTGLLTIRLLGEYAAELTMMKQE